MTFLATMSDTLTANGPELIILLMLVYIIIDNRWTKKIHSGSQQAQHAQP